MNPAWLDEQPRDDGPITGRWVAARVVAFLMKATEPRNADEIVSALRDQLPPNLWRTPNVRPWVVKALYLLEAQGRVSRTGKLARDRRIERHHLWTWTASQDGVPTLGDVMRRYRDLGEHAVVVVFTSTSNAAVPICWCHTETEAIEIRKRLLDDAKSHGAKQPFIWFVAVSDAVRMP